MSGTDFLEGSYSHDIMMTVGKASKRKTRVAKEVRINQRSSAESQAMGIGWILRKPLVHIVLIAALGFFAYSNTFSIPFLFDGKLQIVDNSVIKDLKNFTSDRGGYDYNPRRFIGYLSFALNYHFGGLSVAGYHIVNLLIHIGNAVLVYFFVLLTFRTAYVTTVRSEKSVVNSKRTATGDVTVGASPVSVHHYSLLSTDDSRSFIALFSALLFVSHPLQTQAVTYVVQRFASLATFFYLLSLVMYIKGRLVIEKRDDAGGGLFSGPSLLFYLLSLISAVCAMKTKEMAFTLPLVIALYEFIFFTSPLKKRLLFLVLVLLTLIIVPMSVLHSDRPLQEILSDLSEQTRVQTQMSRWEYLATEMRVIVTYIRLIFLPINQNLDYDYPVYHSLFTPPVFLSFLFLLSIFGLGIYLLFRRMKNDGRSTSVHYRLIGFGVLWFFITLSVESSIIPIVDVIFEHRLYLPLAGAFIGLTTGILIAAKTLSIERIVIPTLALVTIALSGLTYARNTVWRDGISLWQDVVEKSPNKARPYYELGLAYVSQGQLDKATAQFQTAVRLKPDYVGAHNNLGVAYKSQGQLNRAIAEYQTALRLKPDNAEARNNLGAAYASQGQLDRAIAEYQAALRLKPDYAEAHYNLGIVYESQGQLDRAIAEYQAALRLKPDYAEAHNNLGIVYESQGQLDKTITEYQAALRLKPDYAGAHYNLGLAYASHGQLDRATAEFQAAVRLKPDYVEAHYNLGLAYASQGQLDRATAEFQTALRLKPDYLKSHYNLGLAYESQGQLDRAIAEYQAALRLKPDFYEARQRLDDIVSRQH
jgi:tetratricopeptide (TPR) repeat protein